MNAGKMSLLIAALFAGLLILNGCKKSEPEPSKPAAPTAAQVAEDTAKEVVQAVEQTECPVMGGAINKTIFVEYKGKKVYFCCPPCKEKFEADPEQYIAKLPQFKQ